MNNFNAPIDTFVAHTDAVQNNYYLGGPSLPTDRPPQGFGAPPRMNTAFYNLFVITSESFDSTNDFSIPKEQALQDADNDIASALTLLGEQELTAIRSYPMIVATKNHGCGNRLKEENEFLAEASAFLQRAAGSEQKPEDEVY